MSNLLHCPWCGTEALSLNPSAGRSGYANWACGSSKTGNEPWQSTSCELRVADAEIERLRLDIEIAWGLIANAWGGDWDHASEDWRKAAERWRDEAWHRIAGSVYAKRKEREGEG